MFLIPMLFLLATSAFCSFAEAAYFSLTRADRAAMKDGKPMARLAESLSHAPDQLLSTILFVNLIASLLYYTLVGIWGFQLEASGNAGAAAGLAVCALFATIIFAEILPKDIALLNPRLVAELLSVPLYALRQVFRPLFPIFDTILLLSRRLFTPKFVVEPYLHSSDLERAVVLSKVDAQIIRREQSVLQNILKLSEMHNEELMRPRTMQKFFKPPVTLSTIAQYLAEEQVDLDSQGDSPIPGGFLWITDPATDELASAVSFRRYVPPDLEQPEQVWDEHSAPVLFVPWTGTVAETLDRMRQTGTEAAAVVNE